MSPPPTWPRIKAFNQDLLAAVWERSIETNSVPYHIK